MLLLVATGWKQLLSKAEILSMTLEIIVMQLFKQ